MNYCWSRHQQRYEYIVNKGYVLDKIVASIGCGLSTEPFMLSAMATQVFAVDPKQAEVCKCKAFFNIPFGSRLDRIVSVPNSVYDFSMKCDVAVAIEVFEHMESPRKFISHLAKICDWLFITTPLAETTGPTRNPNHVKEYTKEDFRYEVGRKFEIYDAKFQNSKMEIKNDMQPNGDSFNFAHVVQMLWCRRRDA